MDKVDKKTKKLAVMGMLLAVTIILSFIEYQLPPLPFLPPNFKLGISNIIVMYTLYNLGGGSAYVMAILKSLFVLLTRGPVAAFMSISGGLLSVTVILLLTIIFKDKISYLVLSIFGAIAHNIGQLAAARFQFQTDVVKYYLPILILMGIIMGTLTGLLLRIIMPILERIQKQI